MSKIIVAGSINMDIVTRTQKLPLPGETIFAKDLQYIPGGKGSNCAIAASRLCDAVTFVGKLGDDAYGRELRDFLGQERIDLTYLSTHPTAPTGIALIVVNDASENTIVVVSGSNYEVSAEDVAQVPIERGDVIAAPFEIPQETILALFKRAKEAGARTVLNPAPAAPFIDGLAAYVDVLIVNETELAFFAGVDLSETDLTEQMRSLRAHDKQVVIVTLGGDGAVYLDGEQIVKVAGRAVKAVDTTGAGDCFVGALVTGLWEGKALADAVAFANLAASLSVQRIGASASMPSRQEVEVIGI